MALVWALAWAATGVAVAASSRLFPFLPWDVLFNVFDAPAPALGLPGAIGGGLFGLVLTLAGRRRPFAAFTMPRFALLGAAGGVLLSLVPDLLVALGLATLGRPDVATWSFALAKGVVLGALGAASAMATLWVARRARDVTDDPAAYSGDVRHLAASRPVASARSTSATRSPASP